MFSVFSLRNQFAYDCWPQYIHHISPPRLLSDAAQDRNDDSQAGPRIKKMLRDGERERRSTRVYSR